MVNKLTIRSSLNCFAIIYHLVMKKHTYLTILLHLYTELFILIRLLKKSLLLLSKLGKSKSYGFGEGYITYLSCCVCVYVLHLCRRYVYVSGVVTYFLALLANGFSCIISFKRKCVLILLLFLLMNEFSVLNSPTVNCIKIVSRVRN